jgi:hypothetical protein
MRSASPPGNARRRRSEGRAGAQSIADQAGVARVDREHAVDFAELIDEPRDRPAAAQFERDRDRRLRGAVRVLEEPLGGVSGLLGAGRAVLAAPVTANSSWVQTMRASRRMPRPSSWATRSDRGRPTRFRQPPFERPEAELDNEIRARDRDREQRQAPPQAMPNLNRLSPPLRNFFPDRADAARRNDPASPAAWRSSRDRFSASGAPAGHAPRSLAIQNASAWQSCETR